MITRFAPTPSGYLHAGNAVNALLVSWLAAAREGVVALRIDDMDATRYRPEYVDDLFEVLTWLEVPWQVGPRDRADFEAHHSQSTRTEEYRIALAHARERGLEVYACTCSRRHLAGTPTGGCPGGCRTAGHGFVLGRTALRVHVPGGTIVTVGDADVDLAQAMGDFVVWRRDDLPAYQLASVVEDERLAVTHIVRGEDLLESTAAQRFLAPFLGASAFAAAAVVHHGLIRDQAGTKLSKSQLGHGGPLPRDDAQRARIVRWAVEIGAPLGIRPPTR